ncbi:L,D-transpeptidase-like protein [Chitinophaga skermanii]|uniref:L,D-transpeptidase-like protein n=1 Tax=Chitinophaga skermanii TaxID=331697 RepID=A0A327QCA2_9BACT|nr:murein L,D-transpeptidase catalytic domain family protein [Chitinophaga skermanii]RAJ01494.1 L,D-transpeptidase-like protein [Chitinophaga skermanii]
MRTIPISIILLVVSLCLFSCKEEKKKTKPANTPKQTTQPGQAKSIDLQKLNRKATELKQYATTKGFNTHYAFFIDFNVHSGRKRFVLYDLENMKPISKSLVAHGQGSNYMNEEVEFSNIVNSNCSSPGKYKIGLKYSGRFGTAYKLHGLDATNSRAFERFVVLHGHSCVPSDETWVGICRSDGCPTLNYDYFKKVQPIIDQSRKPVLLYIYK